MSSSQSHHILLGQPGRLLRLAALGPHVAEELVKQIASFDPDDIDRVEGTDYPPINDSRVQDISLPTPALYMEALVGRCEGLEPYLLKRREIERQLAQAQADLAVTRVMQLQAHLPSLEAPAGESRNG